MQSKGERNNGERDGNNNILHISLRLISISIFERFTFLFLVCLSVPCAVWQFIFVHFWVLPIEFGVFSPFGVYKAAHSSNRNAFGHLTHSPKSEILRRLCTRSALFKCVYVCACLFLLDLCVCFFFLPLALLCISVVQRVCSMQCKTIRCVLHSRTVCL